MKKFFDIKFWKLKIIKNMQEFEVQIKKVLYF